jgi:hypothetical protein
MDPISCNVILHKAGKACQGQTQDPIGPFKSVGITFIMLQLRRLRFKQQQAAKNASDGQLRTCSI